MLGLILVAPLSLSSALPAEDWPMVKAIIEQESGWNPKAVSPVGAVGLMQLTPIALIDASRACNDEKFGDLFDAAVNVRAGTCYLKYLRQEHNLKNAELFAAYNGGFGVVKRMRRGQPIPTETKDYIRRVGFYLRQYSPKIAVHIVPITLPKSKVGKVFCQPTDKCFTIKRRLPNGKNHPKRQIPTQSR